MITNVSPASDQFDETLNSLKHAAPHPSSGGSTTSVCTASLLPP